MWRKSRWSSRSKTRQNIHKHEGNRLFFCNRPCFCITSWSFNIDKYNKTFLFGLSDGNKYYTGQETGQKYCVYFKCRRLNGWIRTERPDKAALPARQTCFIISVSLIFMETRLTFIFGTWSFMKPFKPLLVRKHFFISSHRCVDVHVFTASPLCALGAGLPHEPRGSAVRAVYQHIIMQPFRRKNTCSSWLLQLNLLICIFQARGRG